MEPAEKILNKLLDKVATDLKYEDGEFNIVPIPCTGENYTSTLFRATLSAKGKRKLDLFAKVGVIGEQMRKQGLNNVFTTEYYVYSKLKNIYREIEDSHNVPEEHRLEIPAFYGFNATKFEEAIVLEDFTVKGYKVQDRLKPLSWEFSAATVTELAKIHSLSFAYSIERPEEFAKTCEELKKDTSRDPKMHDLWRNMAQQCIKVAKEENRGWLEDFVGDSDMSVFVEYYRPLFRPVLIHADSRVSNIMQKVDENGRVHVRLVDYQTLQGASPVIDLLYFIFTSSDEKFRAMYYEKLLDHYYEQLSLGMKRFGLNPQEIYSKADFDFEYNQKLPYGLSIAVFTLPVVTVAPENAPKVTRDMDISCFKVEKTSELFVDRLNGIVNDFIRWGVM